jgi:hypothetical protein
MKRVHGLETTDSSPYAVRGTENLASFRHRCASIEKLASSPWPLPRALRSN